MNTTESFDFISFIESNIVNNITQMNETDYKETLILSQSVVDSIKTDNNTNSDNSVNSISKNKIDLQNTSTSTVRRRKPVTFPSYKDYNKKITDYDALIDINNRTTSLNMSETDDCTMDFDNVEIYVPESKRLYTIDYINLHKRAIISHMAMAYRMSLVNAMYNILCNKEDKIEKYVVCLYNHNVYIYSLNRHSKVNSDTIPYFDDTFIVHIYDSSNECVFCKKQSYLTGSNLIKDILDSYCETPQSDFVECYRNGKVLKRIDSVNNRKARNRYVIECINKTADDMYNRYLSSEVNDVYNDILLKWGNTLTVASDTKTCVSNIQQYEYYKMIF